MASPPQSALSPGTGTPTPAPPSITSTSSISLPSLDILPILVSILSRLKEPSSSSSSLPSGSPPAATHAQSQLQSEEAGPLDLKNLPIATDGLKAALARVRQQVAALPDMRRGIGEQEVEIKELEERVREQRAVLEGLRDWATRGEEKSEEGKMEGVEVGE